MMLMRRPRCVYPIVLRPARLDHASTRSAVLFAALLLLLAAAQSSELPPPPVIVNWTLNVSALPAPKLDNERIQVALYSTDPTSKKVGMSVATQVPLHSVSSQGWSLLSDKSTWGYLFYDDSQLIERTISTAAGPIIVGLGGNVGCHVSPSALMCYVVVGGTWCAPSLHPNRRPLTFSPVTNQVQLAHHRAGRRLRNHGLHLSHPHLPTCSCSRPLWLRRRRSLRPLRLRHQSLRRRRRPAAALPQLHRVFAAPLLPRRLVSPPAVSQAHATLPSPPQRSLAVARYKPPNNHTAFAYQITMRQQERPWPTAALAASACTLRPSPTADP